MFLIMREGLKLKRRMLRYLNHCDTDVEDELDNEEEPEGDGLV